MSSATSWERSLVAVGTPIITWDHADISHYLVSCFKRDEAGLLLQAVGDATKRRDLRFVMNLHDLGGTNFGGTVNYNKKLRRFTFVEYSDQRNYSVRVSLRNPAICCPANPKFPYAK